MTLLDSTFVTIRDRSCQVKGLHSRDASTDNILVHIYLTLVDVYRSLCGTRVNHVSINHADIDMPNEWTVGDMHSTEHGSYLIQVGAGLAAKASTGVVCKENMENSTFFIVVHS